MALSNFPQGFTNGVTIRGIPIVQLHPGKVFYVNNSTVLAENGVGGSDGNPGTLQRPFSTIDYAIGRCTAGRGDIILVMPGHAETVTSATMINMDVAGVAIIGLGTGSSRPTPVSPSVPDAISGNTLLPTTFCRQKFTRSLRDREGAVCQAARSGKRVSDF